MNRKNKKRSIEDMKVTFILNDKEYENVEDLPIEFRRHVGQTRAQILNNSLQRYLNPFPDSMKINCYYGVMRVIKEMGEDNFWGVMDAVPMLLKIVNKPDFDYDKYFNVPIEEIETIKDGKNERTRCILYGVPYYFD